MKERPMKELTMKHANILLLDQMPGKTANVVVLLPSVSRPGKPAKVLIVLR